MNLRSVAMFGVSALFFMALGAGLHAVLAGNNKTTQAAPIQFAQAPDIPPTAIPATTTAVTPTPVVIAPAPTEPAVRSCAEIRASGYNSDAERAFFLAGCSTAPATPTPAPAIASAAFVAQPSSPPPAAASTLAPETVAAAAGPTAEELSYRSRATAQLAFFAARLDQIDDTVKGTASTLNLASVLQQMANSLDSTAPVPARFKDVHDELRSSLTDTSNLMIKYATTNSGSPTGVRPSAADITKAAKRVSNALNDYNLVVGTKIGKK